MCDEPTNTFDELNRSCLVCHRHYQEFVFAFDSWKKEELLGQIHKLTNDNKQGTTLGIRNKYGQKYQLTVIDSPVYTVEGAHGHFFVESKNN